MESLNEDISTYIRENDPTIEELIERFPEVDHWTLRTIRREVKKDLALSATDPQEFEGAILRDLSAKGQAAIRSGFFRPIHIQLRDRPRVKSIFQKAGETYVVFSDLHAPDHDVDALDVVVQIAQSLDPDAIIIAGDGFDVHSLSKYTPAAEKPFRFVDEREKAVVPFIELREQFPETDIYYLLGNHDVRPEKFIAAVAPQLQGLFTIPEILGIDQLGFKVIPEGSMLLANDNLLIKHGTKVSQFAGYSVKREVEAAGMSVIMGHVHRRALIEVTKTSQVVRGDQPWIGVELGCLCNLRPEYMAPEDVANWQHGAAVVTVYDGGLFDIELIRIHNGRAMFRGLLFTSRRLAKS